MNDGSLPLPGHDEQRDAVERYEAMLGRNDVVFFDVDEFEQIIDHYLENSEPRKAQAVLRLAYQQHPGAPDLLYCEAGVHQGMGRLTKALEILDALGRLEPYNMDVLLNKAGIHSQLRNYRRAVEHYRKALELADEGRDEIYLDLAFEYENLEELDMAIDCLKKGLEHGPENEALLYELAYCFELSDAHEASAIFFREFTNEHPYSFVAWYNLGAALSRLDRLDESNDALDLCLAIDERFTSALFAKARNLLLQGRYEEAIDCYNETVRIDGPQAVTYSYIGECYEKMERYEQALDHYDRSIALDPNWVDAWIGRGVVKDTQGRHAEAVKDLEMAIQLAPESGDAHFFLANTLGRMARYEEALAIYTKLNAMEPESLDAWLDHADLLLEVKGPDMALRKLKEGELVHKLDPRFRYRMVSYLLRAGRLQEALLELEEALMADHAAHEQLIAHHPEALHLPQVAHLLELYRR